MRSTVGFCTMLVWFVGGSALGSEPFTYHQDFDLDPAKFVRRDGRIEGDDIRVEGLLSSDNLRSWKLVEGGVAVHGSRRNELLRRENLIRDKYNGANISYVTIRGYRVPWLTLSLGDLDWVDYRVRATVRPGEKCSAGLAFRYQNARQYYAFVLEDQGKASLVLRRHDREAKLGREAWDRLKVVAMDVNPGQTYALEVTVDGPHITCSVDGQQLIEFDDLTLRSGKVAILSDNPAFFGPVSVEGTLVRPELPPLPKCAGVRRLHQIELPVTGRQQYYFLDVDSDGEREIVTAGEDGDGYTWRCFEFDGTEMWKISGIQHPTSEGGDRPMQVFDIDLLP